MSSKHILKIIVCYFTKEENRWELKKLLKKAGAVALAVAMVIGMIPAWSSQAVAETAKKPYKAILEPDIAYDELYKAIGKSILCV